MKLRYIGSSATLCGFRPDNKTKIFMPIFIEQIIKIQKYIESSTENIGTIVDMNGNIFHSVNMNAFLLEN